MTRAALIAGLRFRSGMNLYARTSAVGAWTTLAIGDELADGSDYYPSGGGAADLIVYLSAMLDAVSADVSLSVDLDPDSATCGLITLSKPSSGGSYFELSSRPDGSTFSTSGHDELWAILFPQLARTGTYTLALNGAGDESWTSSRPCLGAFFPRRYVTSDLFRLRNRSAQAKGGGGVSVTHAGESWEVVVGVGLQGSYPRALVENEYHQLMDLLDLLAQGAPVMYAYDITNMATYGLRDSREPEGAVYGRLLAGDEEWTATPEVDDWEARWQGDLTICIDPSMHDRYTT